MLKRKNPLVIARKSLMMVLFMMLGLSTTAAFTGCETTQGLGEDIEGTSERVQTELDLGDNPNAEMETQYETETRIRTNN